MPIYFKTQQNCFSPVRINAHLNQFTAISFILSHLCWLTSVSGARAGSMLIVKSYLSKRWCFYKAALAYISSYIIGRPVTISTSWLSQTYQIRSSQPVIHVMCVLTEWYGDDRSQSFCDDVEPLSLINWIASSHRPWFRYVDARLAMLLSVEGCSSPKISFRFAATRWFIITASWYEPILNRKQPNQDCEAIYPLKIFWFKGISACKRKKSS